MDKRVKYIKKEFIEIFDAFDNNEDISMIYDSYDEYNGAMFNYIKSKDKIWFNAYFDMILDMVKKNTAKSDIKKELLSIKTCNKFIVKRIISFIFDDDLINEELGENTNDEINEQIDELEDIKIEEAINNFSWRNNQMEAIANTINQNFTCGIHNQIMGSGKTLIILNTISEHFRLNPNNKKIYIITSFRQEILKELFFNMDGSINEEKKTFLKNNNIIDLNKYYMINRIHKKNTKITISGKRPTLLVVNIDFLRILDKKNSIDYGQVNFIILDECHSVSASKFYEILKKIKYNYKIPIIGFSATPLRDKAEDKLIDIFSSTFNSEEKLKKLNIISNYDFINAIKDNIILPPCYVLCEVNKTLNGRIGRENKDIMIRIFEKTIEDAPYKKIIGWCRTISHMKEYYKFIKDNFTDLTVYCSSFCDSKLGALGYNTNFNEYMKKKNNCILLCVNRCREGSDIQNVDTAIYLDIVKKRSLLVALQTSGRVLRKDKEGKKTCGFVIDSFVNCNGIQIEVLTANKIINYYKKIFSLCDVNLYENKNKMYDEMIKICSNVDFNKEKEELTLKIDDDNKNNIKFKLELKTLNYDFNKFIKELIVIIDKSCQITRNEKFNKIIETIKKTKHMTVYTLDFWKKYDEMPDKLKLGLPENSQILRQEYDDKFKETNWYELLSLDVSGWYDSIEECRLSLRKLSKNTITSKNYASFLKKDKKLPCNPGELFATKNFTSIEKDFNFIKKKTEF